MTGMSRPGRNSPRMEGTEVDTPVVSGAEVEVEAPVVEGAEQAVLEVSGAESRISQLYRVPLMKKAGLNGSSSLSIEWVFG